MPARRKSYPLPKRFQAALSERAYANLRALNEEYGFSNNYLLTFLLEDLDVIAKRRELDRAFRRRIAEYGAPGDGAGPVTRSPRGRVGGR
ncbi:MAG: hypothetical protein MJE66_16150 [Proteobacteria bacterium]|nr:hypothetical protein [Pseudomonadota bacterium]